MAELELEGYTLGQKHEHYNRLVENAIKSNRTVSVDDFTLENCDVINLINIDIASNNKNVEYILKVLTSDDMLYVSRAVTKSNWLINDKNYAHIINPKYLETNIYPQMCSKAISKFIKHIRYNLGDDHRAEEFYIYEKNPMDAVKWLPRCSLAFIEKNISFHTEHLKSNLLKRLCEKSITVLEIYIRNGAANGIREAFQANMFLLRSNTNKYLDLVESVPRDQYPIFNKKTTSVLMQNVSNRIISKFEKYYCCIHMPTFIRYLKQENIRDFLLNQANHMKSTDLRRFFDLNSITVFLRSMPRDTRDEFVKFVFIDKKQESEETCLLLSEEEIKGMKILHKITSENSFYARSIWYQFAPFKVTFEKVKELIGTVSWSYEKIYLLEALLTSAQHNLLNERTFLEYLRDKVNNTEQYAKEQLLDKLLSESNFLKYDDITWNVLDDIFKSIGIYGESDMQQESIIGAVILYNVVNGKKVPELIENKFDFNSLIIHHEKLDEKEKEMVFDYLYDFITFKLRRCNTDSETEFRETLKTLKQSLDLLNDFKKDLEKYPYLINAIKELVKVNVESTWMVDMESLFQIKKSWRKLLFSESLVLCPTESALFNALKHGPTLLEQNKNLVQNMVYNKDMLLKHFLYTIKIYWPKSFAKDITVAYVENLSVPGDHKAATRGLSILLSRADLQEFIKKYAPKEAKISFKRSDAVELSVRQQFAKTMHIARPQPHPETILWYAKGDYLHYALPSLMSIFYNLSIISSRKYIPQLLDAPVSLQKHGIRLGASKMDLGEILHIFADKWKNNKNASIRVVMFKTLFNLVCNEKDPKKVQEIWELIENFIDNLTFREDKTIYKLLFKVNNIPLQVRGPFYVKCYKFLQKLINSGNEYKELKRQFHSSLTQYSVQIIQQLDSNFVKEILTEFIDEEFMKKRVPQSHSISLLSSYLLQATCEETQMDRYENILLPILKQCFSLWNTEIEGHFFVRHNLTALLTQLRSDVEQCCVNEKKIIPGKMFALIQKELESSLPIQENYMVLTKWKLTVLFITTIDKHQPIINWNDLCITEALEFGKRCNDYLKVDCDKYFPRIYLLFVESLKETLRDFIPELAYIDICRGLTHHPNFIQGFTAAIELLPQVCVSSTRSVSEWSGVENDEEAKEIQVQLQDLCKSIYEHPSIEIKIHYYTKFNAQSYEGRM